MAYATHWRFGHRLIINFRKLPLKEVWRNSLLLRLIALESDTLCIFFPLAS